MWDDANARFISACTSMSCDGSPDRLQKDDRQLATKLVQNLAFLSGFNELKFALKPQSKLDGLSYNHSIIVIQSSLLQRLPLLLVKFRAVRTSPFLFRYDCRKRKDDPAGSRTPVSVYLASALTVEPLDRYWVRNHQLNRVLSGPPYR